MGALFVLVGLAPTVWVLMGLYLLAGAANGVLNALTFTLVTPGTPDKLRGRVLASLNGTARGATVLGGLAGQYLGPRATFITGGALAVLAAIPVAASQRGLAAWPHHPPNHGVQVTASSLHDEAMTIRPASAQDVPWLRGHGGVTTDRPDAVTGPLPSAQASTVLVAELDQTLVGYVLVDASFFGRGFVWSLHVDITHRRRGFGEALLAAGVTAAGTGRVFTSTNLSNHPMQNLLAKMSWTPSGLLHGLDDGDPELFYFTDRPAPSTQPETRSTDV